MSNIYIYREKHYLKGINYYEKKFVSNFCMNMWCGIMVAVLYLN